MNPRKRILIAAIAISVTIAIVCGLMYWRGWHGNHAGKVTNVQLPAEKLHIGADIVVWIDVELPWSRRVRGDTAVNVPEGLQLAQESESRVEKLGFGVRKTRIELILQAYEYGPFEDVEVTVFAEPTRDGKETSLTATLPKIEIVPRDNLDEEILGLASELPDSFLQSLKKRPWWAIVLGLVAVVGLTALFTKLFKPRQRHYLPPAVKPWVRAESAIQDLRTRLPMPADTVFVELIDIIRTYIEAVYNVRATESTTPEFLREINRDGSELFTEHRLLLADFLTAADMVKFARVDTSQTQVEDTIKRGMKFIVETSDSIRRQAEVERQFTDLGGSS
ncbi:MAG: hypothetical protein ACI8W8_001137 [Rhodothermales bacterium]|jgi:hypothetical protein